MFAKDCAFLSFSLLLPYDNSDFGITSDSYKNDMKKLSSFVGVPVTRSAGKHAISSYINCSIYTLYRENMHGLLVFCFISHRKINTFRN